MCRSFAVPLLLFTLVACCWNPCHAGVIFTTLGPDRSFDDDPSQPVSAVGFPPDISVGNSFQVTGGSFAVSSVLAPVSFLPIPSPTNLNAGFTMEIRESDAGAPGIVLERSAVSDLLTPGEVIEGQVLTEFRFTEQTILESGQTYFLTAFSQNPGSFFGWHFSDPDLGQLQPRWIKNGQSDWMQLPSDFSILAFEISGNEVPEPSSIAIFSTCMMLVLGNRRSPDRRKN